MLYIIGIGCILGITMRILQAGFQPGRAQKVITVIGVLFGILFVVALVLHSLGAASHNGALGGL